MSELGHCNKEVSSGSAKTGRGSGDHAHTEQVDRFLHGAAISSLLQRWYTGEYMPSWFI